VGSEVGKGWLTLVLYDYVEVCSSLEAIRREVSNCLRGRDTEAPTPEVFIPANKYCIGFRIIDRVLFEGYVFVKDTGVADFEDKLKRIRGNHIMGPLSFGKRLAYLDEKVIREYQEQLDTLEYPYVPEVGESVAGLDGTFANMPGVVKKVDHDEGVADVLFNMATREVLATNLSYLAIRPLSDDEETIQD